MKRRANSKRSASPAQDDHLSKKGEEIESSSASQSGGHGAHGLWKQNMDGVNEEFIEAVKTAIEEGAKRLDKQSEERVKRTEGNIERIEKMSEKLVDEANEDEKAY